MKVAYLFGSLNRGGTETLLLDVCRSLSKEEFEAIGVYRKKGQLEEAFVQSGIPFYFLPVTKNYMAYFIGLRKLFIKQQVTIVHAQQPLDALLAYCATLFTGIKIILTLHGFDFQSNGRKSLLLSFILKRTNANIYVSNYQRKYYSDRYGLHAEKQLVLYNGIDSSKIELLSNRLSKHITLRDELELPENLLLLGMVGNFNEVRDQLTVCRFLDLLNKEGVDFRFIFVGKRIENLPDRYDRCVDYCREKGLEQKVFFLGGRNDVPEILTQLDAFIYSTEHDTFGIAVVEAIMAGVPVLVNDWEVMKEITANGEYATLYKTKDEKDLVREFMLFLQNRETYILRTKKSAQLVRNHYSIDKHIENLKNIYISLNIYR